MPISVGRHQNLKGAEEGEALRHVREWLGPARTVGQAEKVRATLLCAVAPHLQWFVIGLNSFEN